MLKYTFPRSGRLKHRKAIAALFVGSDGFFVYPLRCNYRILTEGEPGIKAAFSVPKRKFKHAVDRNLIRRRIKEAWRLHRHQLEETLLKHQMVLEIMLIYTGKPEDTDYPILEKAVKKALNHLLKQANEKTETPLS